MNEILIYGRHLAGPFLEVLDLLGTFVFALSGAAAGVKSKLDLFGLMVLAFATGNAGGITRDLLIGAVPPAAIRDWRYLAVCLLAGLVTFWWYPHIDVQRRPILLFDGAGLALFAVTGTQKALAAGLNPVMAALLGMLTGIGGGMLRDVLVNENSMQSLAGLQQHAARERSSAKEAALRSRLNPAGVGSGLKGHDERRSTAPLTPLPTQKVKLCLDTADVVRDVKQYVFHNVFWHLTTY